MSKIKFPQFPAYACIGDTIEWQKDGFTLKARIAEDFGSRPEGSDCYTKGQIQKWKDDEWFFCGIVVSVWILDKQIESHAASLWGIECNFPSRRKNPNLHLSEVAQDLESEALDEGRRQVNRLFDLIQSVK